MSNNAKHLSSEEQRRLFEERGICFPADSHKKDAAKIQEIGYYKLKEFSYAFSKNMHENPIKYSNCEFKDLLNRYYKDKNLRIHVIHAIEDIEVFLNNAVGTLLGEKYGPFGYLSFNNWCDRRNLKGYILDKQEDFKENLKKKINRSNIIDLKLDRNQNKDGFPSIWIMTDCLTFGDTIYLVRQMSASNQRAIAKKFSCSSKELLSWLKCMNFIRNICVHNSDLIDIQLTTKPLIPESFGKYLYSIEIKQTDNINIQYSNRIALPLIILKRLMLSVNPLYNFKFIYNSINDLIKSSDNNANLFGFSDSKALRCLKNRKIN